MYNEDITITWNTITPTPDYIEVSYRSSDNILLDDKRHILDGDSTSITIPAGSVGDTASISQGIQISAINKMSLIDKGLHSNSSFQAVNFTTIFFTNTH